MTYTITCTHCNHSGPMAAANRRELEALLSGYQHCLVGNHLYPPGETMLKHTRTKSTPTRTPALARALFDAYQSVQLPGIFARRDYSNFLTQHHLTSQDYPFYQYQYDNQITIID